MIRDRWRDGGTADADGVRLAVAWTSFALRAGTVLTSVLILGDEAWERPALTALCVILTLTNNVVATIRLIRHKAGVTAHYAFDATAFAVSAALLGGHDSPMWMLAMVLPVVAGLMVPPWTLIPLAGWVMGIRVLLGGPGEEIFVFLATGTSATAIGILVARRRALLLRTMLATDQERRALARVDGGTAARKRTARALIGVATRPLTAIGTGLRGGTVQPGAAAEALREVAAELRAIVAELHAATARPTDPARALRRAALRRVPDADVVCRVDPAVDTATCGAALAVLPEVLEAIASPGTRYLEVTLTADGGVSRLGVAAGPDPSAPDLAACARVRGRPEVVDAEVGTGRGTWTLAAVRSPAAAPAGTVGDPRAASRLIAVVRLGWLLTATSIPLVVGGTDATYPLVIAVTAGALGVSALLSIRRPESLLLWRITFAVNAVLLVVCFAVAGDAQPDLQPLVLTGPLVVAAIFGIRPAVALGAALGVLLPLLGATTQPDLSIGLAWSTAVGVAVAAVFQRFGARTLTAARERNAGLERLLETTARENRALAAALHDDVLQFLLAARQELLDPEVPGATARATASIDRARSALEGALVDLGTVVEHAPGGLDLALRRLCGDDVTLRIGPGVDGALDDLVHTVARELVRNARTHAGPGAHVAVTVLRTSDGLSLEVHDDGAGFAAGRLEEALDSGHIGLASVRDRVEDAGGRFRVSSTPGEGTVALAVLPA